MSLLRCQVPGCIRVFGRSNDLTRHVNWSHKDFCIPPTSASSVPAPQHSDSPTPDSIDTRQSSSPSPPLFFKENRKYHPFLRGDICTEDGYSLPAGAPPPPPPEVENPWEPFSGEVQFRIADLLFREVEMSQTKIDELFDIWNLHELMAMEANGCTSHGMGPYRNHDDMYNLIDSIVDGGAPWNCFQTVVDEGLSAEAPEWQRTSYQIWYRNPDTVIANILANPEFANDFDPAPYVHINSDGQRHWADFMSGNWAWRHATRIYEDDKDDCVDGAMIVPIILGADKTTVSVATGHVEYHPLYLSIGNVTNSARRAHRNAVIPIGFLAIPKSDRKYDNDSDFRIFKKRLYHTSISAILQSLKPGMTNPVIRKCPDGHFRRIIYDLAAFIADYPEQVYVSGIVSGWCGRCQGFFSNLDGPSASDRRSQHIDQLLRDEYGGEGRTLWDNFGIDEHVKPFTESFPRADIHEMLAPDLLHQIIKGCFKDSLVEWCIEYLTIEHGEARANEILDDIDRRLAVVPAFPGLRRFPHGRRFKQWTGDDSKALMKVFLPAVADYLPEDMMKCLTSFLDFCYLVRRSDIDETCLKAIKSSLEAFHHYREIFKASNVRKHFSLPRMHSMIHYPFTIMDFASPNGLCTSITESRHITAVKKPWRRSNRYKALSQILLTNQRLDKLTVLRSALVDQHLLLPKSQHQHTTPFDAENEDVGPTDSGRSLADVKLAKTRERDYPRYLEELGPHINQPNLEYLTRRFLQEQLDQSDDSSTSSTYDIDINSLPEIASTIKVFHSAVAVYFAPSDPCGIRGMRCERIRSTPSWYGQERRDCVLVLLHEDTPGFLGMSIARVLLFFSFQYERRIYPCALVHWYNNHGERPDARTGLWMVKPADWDPERQQRDPSLAVIHLDALVRGVHLIPVYGSEPVPIRLEFHQSLEVYKLFYVNKYADHHANEILF
ncbi:hypothetical protein F5876DRAFT_83350 [Lentinula aff. lateritia]|uniref:Uncharacterized protein n=1 Tax=Lentinula aff. lateritia TaxID=2804960 RepID=A0ACC1TIC7_9AGAR|nr:hypothetical protein F5876DRAFT_83350 [Lentinula aff. lateritia]